MSTLRTGRLYPPGNIPGTHFCYRLSRPQSHSAARRIMSITMTPSGIETATFRLVAQCPNQLPHRVPPYSVSINTNLQPYWMRVSCQLHAPAALLRVKSIQYPINGGLDGPRNSSGRFGKRKNVSPCQKLNLAPSIRCSSHYTLLSCPGSNRWRFYYKFGMFPQ